MAPTILRGSDHFFTTLYEGNGGGQRIGNFVPFTDVGTIAKSCIFDSASNVSLTRTPGSASNRRTFTVSVWVKRGRLGDAAGNNTYGQKFFNVGTSGAFFDIKFSGSGDTEGANRLHIREYSSSSEQIEYWTNRTFKDTSKFYHILVQVDTTQSTSSDRIKVYVDGDEVTSWYRSNAPSQDFDTLVNSTQLHNIGRFTGATSNNFDGYLAELNLVDGSIVGPSTFGVTDTSTGRWIPKSLTGITYGTNGFRMEFANSAGQTIGDDTSGNTNDYTVSNLAVTDITTDSPTQNHFTLDPGRTGTGNTLSEGNLKIVTSVSNNNSGFNSGKLIGNTGKYYFEAVDTNSTTWGIGINALSNITSSGTTPDVSQAYLFLKSGSVSTNGTTTASQYTAWSDGDTLGIAIDMDNKQMKLYVNNTLTYTISNIVVRGREYFIMGRDYSGSGSQTITLNFGQKSFSYTPPTGFKALQQDNLPESTKEGISDLVWIKNRDATDNHQWYDSTRGPLLEMHTNTTDQESTTTDGLQKFLKGGCAIEDDVSINTAGESYVAWNWVANGGTTSANTDGSGATLASTIQANQTAGFSIVQVTAPSSPSGTYKIAHGLGAVPHWIIGKNLENSGGYNWTVYHHKVASDPATDFMRFNTSDAVTDNATVWGDTAPTNSVFTVGTGVPLIANEKTIFYCWTSIEGYSKFGSYSGNNNADGAFIYTGFKPSLVIVKSLGGHTAYPFAMYDNARNPFNPVSSLLEANRNVTEVTLDRVDFLSNGFKWRQSYAYSNDASYTYVYMAFAEHPFVGSGTNPVTAR